MALWRLKLPGVFCGDSGVSCMRRTRSRVMKYRDSRSNGRACGSHANECGGTTGTPSSSPSATWRVSAPCRRAMGMRLYPHEKIFSTTSGVKGASSRSQKTSSTGFMTCRTVISAMLRAPTIIRASSMLSSPSRTGISGDALSLMTRLSPRFSLPESILIAGALVESVCCICIDGARNRRYSTSLCSKSSSETLEALLSSSATAAWRMRSRRLRYTISRSSVRRWLRNARCPTT
mmetsp:Transcript_28234/g.87509  ORF Transcript_28234/g.87509 Transcript_28234/m.87509 type:complete len:234 (-) Transcript_28234:671-1372(-)